VAMWYVVECQTANYEVAASNVIRGCTVRRPTQRAIPTESVNE